MARTLAFWKYEDGVCLNNQAVYEKIADGFMVEGLSKLPVMEILRRVDEVFCNWEKLGDCPYYDPQIETRFDGR